MLSHCQETLHLCPALSNSNNVSYFSPINMLVTGLLKNSQCPLAEKGAACWRGGSNSSLGIVFLPVTAPPGPLVSTLPGGSEEQLLAVFTGWWKTK